MEWRLYGAKAAEVLRLVEPYLVTNKKKQAQLALLFQGTVTGRGKPVSREIWFERERLSKEIKELKTR